ncbi:DUF4303 domain-containing protein [Streptomyces sp. HNM0663]|uniref:DUF4303 domain-containing protein n=1 Tax=Streptomyces chengmaiensis TaxID=3040919 RepID=A0ABT6HSV6_9ACTN|nr:DUF4303 domain-containing protein [Streptomyces chengmaiensis]MDH2391798.1 DUF4303 domain-containing protein [Streptomyces chengmaiensis]
MADELRNEIRTLARTAFASLPAADYSGYALYSDADAMTVCCAANTRAHLARMQADDPEDAEYYRWSPAEWALEGIASDLFEHLCVRLRNRTLAGVDQRDEVYEACVAALADLVVEGSFGDGAAAVVVFAVSDADEAEREVGWLNRLNPPGIAAVHARWRTAAER